jgi:adenylate kinase
MIYTEAMSKRVMSLAWSLLLCAAARAAVLAPVEISPLAFSHAAAPSAIMAVSGLTPAPSLVSVAPAPILSAPAMLSAPSPAPAAVLSPAPALLPALAASLPEKIAGPAVPPAESLAAQASRTFDGSGTPATPADIQGPRLIITGPPGSGKGTYSARLAKDYGVVHVSVGDLLREYAKTDPEIAAVMASGRLVDASLVLRVVRHRLSQPDILRRGFLLDGFPRRQEEASALAQMLGTDAVDGVIVLDVPEEELLRRILARGRADDSAAVFHDRMRIYREQTLPAVAPFQATSPVLRPSVADGDIETNYARVKNALGALLDKLLGRGA